MPEVDGDDSFALSPVSADALWSSGATAVTRTDGIAAGGTQASIAWRYQAGVVPPWHHESNFAGGTSDVYPPQPAVIATGDFRGDPPDGFVDPFDLVEAGSAAWAGSLAFVGQTAVYDVVWKPLPANDGIHLNPGVLGAFIQIDYDGAFTPYSIRIDGIWPVSLTADPYYVGTDGQQYWAPFYLHSGPDAIDDDGSDTTVASRIVLRSNNDYTPPAGDTTGAANNYRNTHGFQAPSGQDVLGNHTANAQIYFEPDNGPPISAGQKPTLPILNIRQIRTWRHFAYANPPTPQTAEIHLDTYEARTGLSSHPGTAATSDGWSIYAAVCDIKSLPSGSFTNNQVVVIAQPPEGITPTGVKVDLLMNSAVLNGFNAIPVGANLGEDEWEVGKDQNIGIELTQQDDGTWSTLYGGVGGPWISYVAREYYVDLPHAVTNGWTSTVDPHTPPTDTTSTRDGSKALDHFVGKWNIGEVLIDTYFLLAAAIRIDTPGEQDYPNVPDSSIVVQTVFYLGTPLALSLTAKDLGSTYNFS